MKRYNSVYEGVYTKPNEMVEEPNGDWVRWEDVQREYAREWITDRRPTSQDAQDSLVIGWCLMSNEAHITYYRNIKDGDPWMPIGKVAPYVKPKRFAIGIQLDNSLSHHIYDLKEFGKVADKIPTREAAERIAAIYDEVMP